MRSRRRCAPFTPMWFLVCAGLVTVAFGLLHLFGARNYTSILSGTAGSTNGSVVAALLGLAYAFAYFATVLVAPVLVIAAGVMAALTARRRAP